MADTDLRLVIAPSVSHEERAIIKPLGRPFASIPARPVPRSPGDFTAAKVASFDFDTSEDEVAGAPMIRVRPQPQAWAEIDGFWRTRLRGR